jgi:hypothetical protein
MDIAIAFLPFVLLICVVALWDHVMARQEEQELKAQRKTPPRD